VEDYFGRPEVSNSDLTWLFTELLSSQERRDFTDAYRIGSLIDAMITEPQLVNYFKFTLNGEQYTPEEFALCEKMKDSFRRDEFCRMFMLQCTGQKVMSRMLQLQWGAMFFSMPFRCKYDLWSDALKYGGDIKSTTATTQKQFVDSVFHFSYDRQRATYMEIAQCDKDLLIGISKVNGKIFKLPIVRGDETHQSGLAKMQELSFKFWSLFAPL
jgi:hypothetical protein